MDTETDTTDVNTASTPQAGSKRLWLWGMGITAGLLFGAAAFSFTCNQRVIDSAKPFVIQDISTLPNSDVGLVLGTSTYTRSGASNRLFDTRMWAAANLYNLGKVKHLLVSGANPDETYNEPRKMYKALVAVGVPPEAITMDFAGFRTLDSVVRANKVFGQSSFIIVSQEFHNYRAVYLARAKGLDVLAYAVPEEEPGQNFRTELREFFARVGAVLDVHVFNTQPRFLGEPVPLENDG